MKALHLVLLFFVLANLLTPHTCDEELESDGDEAGVMVENKVSEHKATNSSSSKGKDCIAKENCSEDDFCYCYTSKKKKTCYRDQSECLAESGKHKHHGKSSASSSGGKSHHHHHPPPPPTETTMADDDTPGTAPPPPPPKGHHKHNKTKSSSSSSSSSSTSLPPSTGKGGKAPPPGDEPSPPNFSLPPVGAPEEGI